MEYVKLKNCTVHRRTMKKGEWRKWMKTRLSRENWLTVDWIEERRIDKTWINKTLINKTWFDSTGINKHKDCCGETQLAETDVFPVVASLHPTYREERCVTTLKTAV